MVNWKDCEGTDTCQMAKVLSQLSFTNWSLPLPGKTNKQTKKESYLVHPLDLDASKTDDGNSIW